MADPINVAEALNRIATELSRIGQIVDAEHPDFFLFDEWQQPASDERPHWRDAARFVIPDQPATYPH